MNHIKQITISEETKQRLSNHGLILTIREGERNMLTQDYYMEEVGEYHTFLGCPGDDVSISDFLDVDAYMSTVIDEVYPGVIKHMQGGAVWYPIYDIGLNKHEFTVKKSKKTAWPTLCGVIIADASDIFDELGIDSLDAEGEKIVIERFENHLKLLGASHNGEVYDIEVATDGNKDYQISRKNHACHDVGCGIDTDINILISGVIASVNSQGLKIEFSIDRQIIDMGINPVSYINKKLKMLLGFTMVFGSVDFDEQSGTLKTTVMRNTLPLLYTVSTATGESLYQGIYKHITNLENIEETDVASKLKLLSKVTAMDFNYDYSNTSLLSTFLGVFDYVHGVEIKSLDVMPTPF